MSLKVIKLTHICASVPKPGEQRGPPPGPSHSWHAATDFLPTAPTSWPGRALSSCFHQQGAQKELLRLHYLGKKLMVAAAAALFISGNLQGHFKVKTNLCLQQVPKCGHQAGRLPQPRLGFARDPAPSST